jgi:hypothetical protein
MTFFSNLTLEDTYSISDTWVIVVLHSLSIVYEHDFFKIKEFIILIEGF